MNNYPSYSLAKSHCNALRILKIHNLTDLDFVFPNLQEFELQIIRAVPISPLDLIEHLATTSPYLTSIEISWWLSCHVDSDSIRSSMSKMLYLKKATMTFNFIIQFPADP